MIYDILYLSEYLESSYIVPSRLYLSKTFPFNALLHDLKEQLAGWQSVELFTILLFGRKNFYQGVPVWRPKYNPTVLLFFPAALLLVFDSQVTVQGKACDKTGVWKVVLAEYGSLPMITFMIKATSEFVTVIARTAGFLIISTNAL